MMNPERYERVREIFHAALDLERAERAEFLLRICGDDAALRAEVESLLAARDRAAPFLEPTDAGDGERSPLVGKMLGRYEVVRELGRASCRERV